MAGKGALKGRCAGCGKIGSHCAIEAHVIDCPEWLAAYAVSPSSVLDPAAEYQRWMEIGRADDRAIRREAAVAANQEWRDRQSGRFARSKDITEEDLT